MTALTTRDAGYYKAAFLTPGIYTVRVQAPGFRTFEEKRAELQLAPERAVNAFLLVGAGADTVEVRGSTTPLLVNDTSQLSANFQADRWKENL
jgi:hypothetical protein